jgi:presenilin-like A22 family membrane protease
MSNKTHEARVNPMKPTATAIQLTPILASLLFGILCALLISTIPTEIVEITPFPEGPGSIGNALFFVVLVGVGASLLYVLLKRKNQRLISWITGFALLAAVFMLSVIYFSAVFSWFPFSGADYLTLILPFFTAVLAYYAIFRLHNAACDVAVLCIGGALGAFLGATIQTLSTVLILGFLAVYDAFAVYHGPVGKIARSGLEQLRGLSFSFREVQMGLGDLTFYSMLAGHMFIFFGFASSIASIVGILLGCLLSFKMLEKKGMFPGLPFPIIFGLTAGFLAARVLL